MLSSPCHSDTQCNVVITQTVIVTHNVVIFQTVIVTHNVVIIQTVIVTLNSKWTHFVHSGTNVEEYTWAICMMFLQTAFPPENLKCQREGNHKVSWTCSWIPQKLTCLGVIKDKRKEEKYLHYLFTNVTWCRETGMWQQSGPWAIMSVRQQLWRGNVTKFKQFNKNHHIDQMSRVRGMVEVRWHFNPGHFLLQQFLTGLKSSFQDQKDCQQAPVEQINFQLI